MNYLENKMIKEINDCCCSDGWISVGCKIHGLKSGYGELTSSYSLTEEIDFYGRNSKNKFKNNKNKSNYTVCNVR